MQIGKIKTKGATCIHFTLNQWRGIGARKESGYEHESCLVSCGTKLLREKYESADDGDCKSRWRRGRLGSGWRCSISAADILSLWSTSRWRRRRGRVVRADCCVCSIVAPCDCNHNASYNKEKEHTGVFHLALISCSTGVDFSSYLLCQHVWE